MGIFGVDIKENMIEPQLWCVALSVAATIKLDCVLHQDCKDGLLCRASLNIVSHICPNMLPNMA